MHFKCDSTTAELLLSKIISVNLLSVYGAVSGLCEKLAQKISDHSSSSTGDLMRRCMTNRSLESHPILCQSQRMHLRSMFKYRETCCSVKTKRNSSNKASEDAAFCEKDFLWTRINDSP